MLTGLEIAASGMNAQRVRLNIVSSNLANSATTHTPEGGPYQRREAVFSTTVPRPADAFADGGAGGDGGAAEAEAALRGVRVQSIRKDTTPGPLVYDPTSPDADANGNVRMANVNMVEEMVDMITASRSFEANVAAFQTLKQMARAALTIGR